MTNESTIPFMSKLADYYKVNLIQKIENSPVFKEPAKKVVFYAQSDRNHYIITTYLTKFPLMTSKYLNYLSFYKGLNNLGKNFNLTREDILWIRSIKQSISKVRTEYNWNYLHNFYSKGVTRPHSLIFLVIFSR